MRKKSKLGTVDIVALVLAILALATWAVWHYRPHSHFIQSWGPNIGTDFASLAVALAGIDRLLSYRERRRLEPIRDRVVKELRLACVDYCQTVATDYLETHVDSYEPIPLSAIAALDMWLEQGDTADETPTIGHFPADLLGVSMGISDRIEHWRAIGGDVLDPHLTAAVLDFGAKAQQLRLFVVLVGDGPLSDFLRPALTPMVQSARALAVKLAEDDPSALELPFVKANVMDAMHDRLVQIKADQEAAE